MPRAPAGRIAFSVSDQEGRPVIHTVLPDGTDQRRLGRGHTPQWSPDGSRLAFLDDAPLSSVFVQDADGTDRRRLTYDNIAFGLRWAPVAAEIAFVACRPNRANLTYSPLFPVAPACDGEINVVDVSTGALRPITAGPDFDAAPSWSPDGAEVAFQRSQDGGQSHLAVVKRDGTGLRRTWAPPGSAYLLGTAWQPAARIAVAAGGGGDGDDVLWTVNADGTDAQPLALRRAEWAEPEWSPAGDAVLVSSLNSSSIAAVTVAGRVLFERAGSAAAWSPDGAQVAFCAHGGVWRMDRDGSNAVQVVAGCDAWPAALAWSVPTGGAE